jgi:hypothetical protein
MKRQGWISRRDLGRGGAAIASAVALGGLVGFAARGRSTLAAWAAGLGESPSLGGHAVFPVDDPWNRDISRLPVDPNSDALIRSIGIDKPLHPDFGTVYAGAPIGIPYVVVPGPQPRVPVRFEYADESDPGPYPIPPGAPIEGGPKGEGDRHVLVIDRDNWKLYELFSAHPRPDGSWQAGSGAIFDLKTGAPRPAGWTSADAAGLPIFPGLVRYEEACGQEEIAHALRFTCRRTRRAYIPPARHFASRLGDANLPPMGMRVRLRASFDLDGFPPAVKVILVALKRHGMLLADNGSDWYVSGAPDRRWDDNELHALKRVKGRDLEVVKMDGIVSG